MAQKIKITADSTCDLSPELIEKYDICITPFLVRMGDDEYTDGVDITPKMMFEYVEKTNVLPQTAALTIFQYTEIFKKYVDEGYEIIHISLSSEISSTYNNACLAAEDVGHVHVVDSRNLSTGSGLVVLEICDMVKEGKDVDEILSEIEKIIPKVNTSFILGNLDYMKKGGRCSSVAVLGANVLKLRASIEVKDGKMGVGKKYRGPLLNVLKEYAEERLNNTGMKIRKKRIFVTSTCLTDTLPNAIKELLEAKNFFDEIIITYAGATICSHCGEDTLGILFIEE